MVKIYHVPGTRSIRAIWACEELGVPYEAVPVDFTPAFRNSPEWRAISPTGKVPAMEDGDLVMFESGAMVDAILERHDRPIVIHVRRVHACRYGAAGDESAVE